ncbi:hypothetical protein ASF39_15505 [Methylobacterium sp. Leaf108]|nr:hypothetical protein ASF39_15505 [Methylobacterium sp. Leaf108]
MEIQAASSRDLLPAVDVSQPETLLSLPPWLATQIAAVSDLGYGRTVLDPTTKAVTGQVATIPRSKMPTGPQRAAIARRIEDLHAASMPGPIASTLAVIGAIVNRNAAARQDADLADIEIEAYRDALDDLPAWAVREALRRWRRGEVGGDRRNLDFAPKEHRLRSIALSIEAVVRGQIVRLQRLLEAEEEPERPTEAEREATLKEVQARMKAVGDGADARPVTLRPGHSEAERIAAERDLAERKAAVAAEAEQQVAEDEASAA